jgi:hypothetical protein
MNIALDASTLSLARDGLIAVRDGQGARIRCVSGHLWITEDRSQRDRSSDRTRRSPSGTRASRW